MTMSKFVAAPKPTKSSNAPQGALSDLSSLQKEVRDLKASLKRGSKSLGKQKSVQQGQAHYTGNY